MMNCKIGAIILVIIFIAGCAPTTPEIKLMPKQSAQVYPFFRSGQPIAAVQSANAFMLMSLEMTMLANQPYNRLWILYQNTSEEPFLLEPLRFVSLNVTSITKSKTRMTTPESPTRILASISNEKALSMIMQAIGGTLQEMAAKPTSVKTRFNDGSSATSTFNDQQEKRNIIADRTADAMTNTALWYDIYRNSISDGILRKNTVFPGESVNGFIYFPAFEGKVFAYEDNKNFPSDVKYFFAVKLKLSGDSLNVDFTPIEGE